MNHNVQQSQQDLIPYKLVISEIVKKHKIHEYDKWIYKINQEIQDFNGFLGIDVIRPRSYTHLEFVIIIKFATYEDLKYWLKSPTRLEWLEKSNHWVEAESHIEQPNRNEMYFSFPSYYPEIYRPSYLKLVIIGILAVYPLIILVNFLLGFILPEVHYLFQVFFSVILVTLLLNRPVLPFLTKILDFWLYPQKTLREFSQTIDQSNSDNVHNTSSVHNN